MSGTIAQQNGPSSGLLATFGFLMGLCSVPLLVLFAIFALPSLQLLREGAVITGTVVSIDRGEDGESRYAHPVMSYEVAGQEYTLRSGIGYSPSPYGLGDSAPVRYLLADPATARLDTLAELWMLPVMMGGFSLLTLIPMVALFIAAARRRA